MPKGRPLQLTHNSQQQAIVAAFKHAWKGYKTHCWGKDELKPISGSCSTWFNLGLTLVDSLDTMWLMGLEEEFTAARNWVENEMVVAQNRDVNLFETTIRTLGGLLSAYHLTEDQIFLNRAVSLHCHLKPLISIHFSRKNSVIVFFPVSQLFLIFRILTLILLLEGPMIHGGDQTVLCQRSQAFSWNFVILHN